MVDNQRKFREGLEDFSAAPDRLIRLIDSGKCTAVVNFHMMDQDDGTTKLAMISAGMTQTDIFNAICIVRRSLMSMLGIVEMTETPNHSADNSAGRVEFDFTKVPDFTTGAYKDAPAHDPVDDHLDALPQSKAEIPVECQGCGRPYWSLLGTCEHVGCPKGLYAP